MLSQREFESVSSPARGPHLRLSEVPKVQFSFYPQQQKELCDYGCVIINNRSMFCGVMQQNKLDPVQVQAQNCISVYLIRTWYEVCANIFTFTLILC